MGSTRIPGRAKLFKLGSDCEIRINEFEKLDKVDIERIFNCLPLLAFIAYDGETYSECGFDEESSEDENLESE